jgi:hypothetical protein
MPRFTASIQRFVVPSLLVVGVAACSGPIVDPPVSGGPGVDRGAGGGAGPIAPATCLGAEAMLVAATTPKQTVIAVQIAGTWLDDLTRLPAARQAVAYLDLRNRLAVLWIDRTYAIEHTHSTATSHGTSFEQHDLLDWHPEATTRILGLTDPYLVDRDDSGAGVAFLLSSSPGVPWANSTLLDATSFAIRSGIRSGGPSMLFVGPGAAGELCEHSIDLDDQLWRDPLCHPDILVASDGHAPNAGPLLVPLPNGDVVAVHFPAGTSSTLGATVLQANEYLGHWTVPVATTTPAIGLSFAAAATPDGDVIVGVISPRGDLAALRFSPSRGWSAPIAIDAGVPPGQRISVAPGICGDDARIAYAVGESDGEIRVARVRGGLTEATTAAQITGAPPSELSLITRSRLLSPVH